MPYKGSHVAELWRMIFWFGSVLLHSFDVFVPNCFLWCASDAARAARVVLISACQGRACYRCSACCPDISVTPSARFVSYPLTALRATTFDWLSW